MLSINGDSKRVTKDCTVAALLRELNLNVQQLAVEVNEELVPRESHKTRVLTEGDQIEVVTLVGGG